MRVETINALQEKLPVAMDLDAWLDAAEATGPSFGSGLRYMLRSNRFGSESRLAFLRPFEVAQDTGGPHPRIDVTAAYVESGSQCAPG